MARVGGAGARALHQVGAVDAAEEIVAERIERPDERLAVGHREARPEHRLAQLGIVATGHDRVHGGDADVAPLADPHHRVDRLERALVVRDRERDPEQGVFGRHPRGGGRQSGWDRLGA